VVWHSNQLEISCARVETIDVAFISGSARGHASLVVHANVVHNKLSWEWCV